MVHSVVWIVWDAAADWVVRALLAEGALPALARIASTGARAAARPPSPNCQTPPSLATLFTGAWPREHGITGFSVPDPASDRPITARRSGFDPTLLSKEPVWECAVRQERTAVLSHVPWVTWFQDSRKPARALFAVEGYSQRVLRGDVVRVSNLRAGEDGRLAFELGPYQLAVETKDEQVTVEVLSTGELITLHARVDEGWKALVVEPESGCGTHLRALRRRSDGELLLLHSGIWRVRTVRDEDRFAFQTSTGPFVGEGLGSAYRRGAVGPRVVEGGTGYAEQVLVQSIALSARYFQRSAVGAATRHPGADLYMSYQPCIDDIEHELIGWCDPRSKGYRPDVVPEAWKAVRSVYQMADDHLNSLLEYFGDECTFIVSSDHGMAGSTHTIHVNDALRQAGLLAFDSCGLPDLAHTKIAYHPANNGSLWVNAIHRAKGSIPASHRDEVVADAIQALKSIRHPETNEPVVQAVYPQDGGEEAGWTPHLGDLFLVAADGCELSAAPAPGGEVVSATRKSASHVTNPDRASLRGIFYACGPNLRNVDLGEIDNRDCLPLGCNQLGIAPPPDLEGQVPVGILGY